MAELGSILNFSNLVELIIPILIAILIATFTYSIPIIGDSLARYLKKTPKEDPLLDEINRLNHIFNEAQELIPKISDELNKKKQAVNQLKADYETYNNIPQLSKENLAALQNVFQTQLKTEGNKPLALNIIIGAFLLLLGIFLQKYFF